MPRAHGTHRPLPAYDLAVRAAAGSDHFHDAALRARIEEYKVIANFPKFCEDILKIRTKQAVMVPFKLNRAQRFLWENHIRPALESGKPAWFYLLKARQMGWTTMIQALKYYRTTLWPDVQAFTAAHEEKSVRKIFNISKLFYRLAPAEFRPEQKTSNRIELHFANPSDVGDLGLESYLTVAPATNENLGASQTLQFAHLSEFALYDQRALDVEAMLVTFFQTIVNAPLTLVVLETTARPGYGQEYWDRDNRFTKIFLPWVADEQYRDEVPLDADALQKEGKYGDEFRAREETTEALRFWYSEHAGDEAWFRHESLCRLAWRRLKIDEVVRKGGLQFFRREYPLTPEEAFSVSTTGVFDSAVLYAAKQRAQERLMRAEPGYFLWTRRPAFGEDRWQRRPLAEQLTAAGGLSDLEGFLQYEAPREGAVYTIGVDPGAGHPDSDPSAIQVLRRGEGDLKGASFQAAVYRGLTGAIDLAHLAAEIGKQYNWGLITPEANGLGQGLVDELVHEIGYPHVYRRLVVDESTEVVTEKFGFNTSPATKPLIISILQVEIANELLFLRDLGTIGELLVYSSIERGRSKVFEAPKGKCDDLTMALAFAIFGAREQPLPDRRPKTREDRWWEGPPSVFGRTLPRPAGARHSPASMFG